MSDKKFAMWRNLFLPRETRHENGTPEILGATVVAGGVNFALYSANARRVQLLIFENPSRPEPTYKVDLNPWKNKTGQVWHVFVRGVQPGAGYAYRVAGAKKKELKFDVHKILLDPYARAIDWRWYDRAAACVSGDNLRTSLRGLIVGPEADEFDWRNTPLPAIDPANLIIYELHPKGFTANPNSGVHKSGYFARLKEKLSYLKGLGINAIELMPIQAFDNDQWQNNHWGEALTNYWGYSTLSYFALHREYFASEQPAAQFKELKEFVRACHSQGIAVIMDVVYNHTTEGNHDGPCLSYRGIDNQTYYITSPDDRYYYMDFTGCGHTFNVNHPAVSRLIQESLEYFVREFRIDGFRFDLAACFYYNPDGYFMADPPLVKKLAESEVLSRCHLIAEPWDATGLNMLGNFGGPRWLEWNGHFRDYTRRLLAWDDDKIACDWAETFWGETPLFLPDKSQAQSINFITCHDGFTLADLVSYSQKHNAANGYNDTDGADCNYSTNSGAEGPTDMSDINDRRGRQMKNFLALLLMSKGSVMLNMGDEVARSQGGNNNAFNQDNLISYFDWDLVKRNSYLYNFTANLIKFRQKIKLGEQLMTAEFKSVYCNRESGTKVVIAATKFKNGQYLCVMINSSSEPEWVATETLAPPQDGENLAAVKWRQIVDTNNLSPDDFTMPDLATEISGDKIFLAPESLKVLLT